MASPPISQPFLGMVKYGSPFEDDGDLCERRNVSRG